jgi:hypothetical protein
MGQMEVFSLTTADSPKIELPATSAPFPEGGAVSRSPSLAGAQVFSLAHWLLLDYLGLTRGNWRFRKDIGQTDRQLGSGARDAQPSLILFL